VSASLVNAMRAVNARAYVRVIGANREISWVLSEVVLPILSVTAYVFLYRALGAPRLYEALVILGGAMIPFWLIVLWSMAMQLYWEKETGNLDIFLSAPADPIALLLGMALGGLFMGGLRTVLIILIGALLFHVEFAVSNWWLLTAMFLLTLSALFAMGMAAASVYFVTGRTGYKLNIALMEPVYMLTGVYFPMKNLGFVLSVIASFIPISLGLDGMRQLCLPGKSFPAFLSAHTEALILVGMTILFGLASVYLLRFMAEKGRRDGTLTQRWQ